MASQNPRMPGSGSIKPKPIPCAQEYKPKGNQCRRGHDLLEHGKWVTQHGTLTRICKECRRIKKQEKQDAEVHGA